MDRIGQVLWLFRLGIDWWLFTEGDNANLNKSQQVRVWVSPLVQIGQVDLPCSIHMLGHLHLHVRRGLDKG